MSDQDKKIEDNWKRPLILGSIAIIIAVIAGIIGIYLYNKAKEEENLIYAVMYLFWL